MAVKTSDFGNIVTDHATAAQELNYVCDTLADLLGITSPAPGSASTVLADHSLWQANGAGVWTKLNNTVAQELSTTQQNAAIAMHSMFTMPSANGTYKIVYYCKIITPAAAGSPSSTLGPVTIQYTDAYDSVVVNLTDSNTKSTNNNQTVIQGQYFVSALANSNIGYSIGYAATGIVAMTYSSVVLIEQV